MEVTLRPWRPEDAEFAAQYADDREIARWLRDIFPHPYARQDAENFVRACLAADEEHELLRVVELDGQPAGSIALTRGTDVYRMGGELGYWLGRPFWGRGAMTETVKQMCRLGFARWDIVRIFAQPFADNLASRRVLEKAGFSLEGTLRQSVCKWGRLQDSCIYALLREESV